MFLNQNFLSLNFLVKYDASISHYLYGPWLQKNTIQFSFFTPCVAFGQLFSLEYSGINKILECLLTDQCSEWLWSYSSVWSLVQNVIVEGKQSVYLKISPTNTWAEQLRWQHNSITRTDTTVFLVFSQSEAERRNVCERVVNAELSSFKVSKAWDACCKLRQRRKCPVFLVPEAPNNSRGVWGMLRQNFFEICARQIAGNAQSRRPFCFFNVAC